MIEESRCLLLSCAKAKRTDKNSLTAIERYDGPYFRVLRRFFRESPNARQATNVLILSAKYGLIDEIHPVKFYDHRMTLSRAEELRPQVQSTLKEFLTSKSFKELFILLGKDYQMAMHNFEVVVPSETRIIQAEGAQGIKAKQLKNWLYRTNGSDNVDKTSKDNAAKRINGQATIHGCRISMHPAQVMEIARKALACELDQARNFRGWYVMVDEVKVGPKWIVSHLSGLPVSAFSSGEARRVLYKLGIPVVAVEKEEHEVQSLST